MKNPLKSFLDSLYLNEGLSQDEFRARIEGVFDGLALVQAFGTDLLEEITAITDSAKSAAQVNDMLNDWIDEQVDSKEWPDPPELVKEVIWN